MGAAHKLLIAAIAALSLSFSAPAMAAESSIEGYSNDDKGLVKSLDDEPGGGGSGSQPTVSPPAETADSGISGLPFTGRDAGLIGAAGAFLALLGFGLRRLTASPSRAV